jgi:hypothetical protein
MDENIIGFPKCFYLFITGKVLKRAGAIDFDQGLVGILMILDHPGEINAELNTK